jgi:ubiquinone/menaquinone biosynthesis C-methylase UbiE
MTTDNPTFDRLAAPYDRGMAPLEKLWLRQMRTRLLPHATGRVLEIGVGTGANMPFYPSSSCISAIDESTDMLAASAARAAAADRPIRLIQANAEHLAFPDNYFDSVLCSLVLCSVVEPHRVLAETKRVLRKPRGRLLLLEHMRPHMRPLAWLADALNVPWYALNGRCHLNRTTQQTITEVGFRVEHVEPKMGGLLRLIVARTS